MKSLRKSSLITVLFLGTWLWTTLTYATQVVCSCCSQKVHQCVCREESHAEQLLLKHENHQEVKNHHQGEHQCHQEDNNCSCTKSGNSGPEEATLKTYLPGKEKKQVLTPSQDILESKLPLPKNTVIHLEGEPTAKFRSLFLLNSSFLM